MVARAYCAHPSIRDHCALKGMSRYLDQVVSLKRDPQCLSPQASLVLIYRPTAVQSRTTATNPVFVPIPLIAFFRKCLSQIRPGRSLQGRDRDLTKTFPLMKLAISTGLAGAGKQMSFILLPQNPTPSIRHPHSSRGPEMKTALNYGVLGVLSRDAGSA
ncbi:hypothetical protein TNCV_2628611 [Trichonephila clavipes]|uniref:Uncharacterized protein n=1 Tax=Trichonephila clavipes TaxID=2585209 RepID=A0A8X6SJA1_TRICX|nr:hypothetical protein TNCV_2628611 [Trichonephila clavipes]